MIIDVHIYAKMEKTVVKVSAGTPVMTKCSAHRRRIVVFGMKNCARV